MLKKEKREANRLAQARYRKTKKGKASQAKYNKSSARKKSLKKYNLSEKNKLNQKRYNKKPKAKKLRNQANKRYRQTKIGKEKKRQYQRSPKYRAYINTHRKTKYNNDSNFKIRLLYSNRVKQILDVYEATKKDKFSKLLGCSIETFKKHIEKQFKPGMTWANHGSKTWHIDHIIPCKSFDLNDKQQQKKCFNYKNLQPLKAIENLKKGSKMPTQGRSN